MQVFSSTKRKIEATVMLTVVSVIGFLGYLEVSAAIPTDPEKLAALIGPYGPAGIIGTQFAQVLIAPIPPVTPVISGMLYGTYLGTFYSTVGAALGSLAALLIARKYGRTAAERFLTDEAMDKFDEYTSGHGYLPFIILFVFPGFPDDALCFIAGLTNLDLKKLFLISSLGRIPGIALLALTGTSAAQANTGVFVLSAFLVLSISYGSVRYEQKLEETVVNIEHEIWNY